jgi:hypothetical protein
MSLPAPTPHTGMVTLGTRIGGAMDQTTVMRRQINRRSRDRRDFLTAREPESVCGPGTSGATTGTGRRPHEVAGRAGVVERTSGGSASSHHGIWWWVVEGNTRMAIAPIRLRTKEQTSAMA